MGQSLVAAVVAADGLGLLQGSQRAEDTTFSRSTGGATATDHRTQCGGIPVTTDREQLAVRNIKGWRLTRFEMPASHTRHLMPFSRPLSTAASGMVGRQVRQIVQS